MKEIPLTQNKVALIDDEDYESLSRFKWFARWDGHNWYAGRKIRRPDGERRTVFMHKEIIGTTTSIKIDHKDGDGLNNTRHNLRPATTQQNNCNNRIRRDNTSGYKGVNLRKEKHCRKWQASIRVNRKRKHLGYYDTPQEAALAYDVAARELFGEFARTNFSQGTQQ